MADLTSVVADLDALIQQTGEALSAAVTSDEQAERLSANGLRSQLDALSSARSVLAGFESVVVVVNVEPAPVEAASVEVAA